MVSRVWSLDNSLGYLPNCLLSLVILEDEFEDGEVIKSLSIWSVDEFESMGDNEDARTRPSLMASLMESF